MCVCVCVCVYVGDLETKHSLTHIIQVGSDHIHGFTWACGQKCKSFPSLGFRLRQTCLGELGRGVSTTDRRLSGALREHTHAYSHVRVHTHSEEAW